MRQLIVHQKKLLKKWHEAGARTVDDLTLEEMETLEKINDHETIWHNANRFLSDLTWAKL